MYIIVIYIYMYCCYDFYLFCCYNLYYCIYMFKIIALLINKIQTYARDL